AALKSAAVTQKKRNGAVGMGAQIPNRSTAAGMGASRFIRLPMGGRAAHSGLGSPAGELSRAVGPNQNAGVDGGDVGRAAQPHGRAHLVRDDLEAQAHARFAKGAQAI